MSSKDLATVVKTQKAFIKELLDRLEGNFYHNKEIMTLKIQGYDYFLPVVETLLNDSYFNGLTLEQILELAKKSIRLTKDNCDMTHKLEDLLEKAKINGDNYYVNEITAILKPQDF